MQTVSHPVLLIIGYVWPEPNSSAAGSRMLQLIQAFQDSGYAVHYGSPAESSDYAVDLAALNIQAHELQLNSASFDQFIQQLQPAVVLFDRFMMEEQFGWRVEKFCPQSLRILDSVDLHSLRYARHEQLKAEPNRLPIEPGNEFLFSDKAIREIAAILRCDLTLVISEVEMIVLRERFNVPATQLLYVPFMQQQHTLAQVPEYSQRQHFISIGNFRHEPNWDAVRYLKEQIWTGIRKQLPQAQLHIYGAYPPKKAMQLHNEREGFLVKGWADDAYTVVQEARVLLAPLRFGAGLKGKLMDAAVCGTPAITTSIGAEGTYAEGAEAALIADTPTAFIEAAVQLYQDQTQWQQLSQHGLGLITQRFDYAEHAPRLMAQVQQLRETLAQHRQQHFYGLMLRHHTLKSTQYMAQWIEAKNRNDR